MINVKSNSEKTQVIITLTDHSLYPYGTQELCYAMNEVSLTVESGFVTLVHSDSKGTIANALINDIKINGEAVTESNIQSKFAAECLVSPGSGGGESSGTTCSIVDALTGINTTLQNLANINDKMDKLDDITEAIDELDAKMKEKDIVVTKDTIPSVINPDIDYWITD